jgi:Tol biopolymer transport system component
MYTKYFQQYDSFGFLSLMAICLLILIPISIHADISGKIAFQSFRNGSFEICIMDANGNNQRNVTNHPAMDMYPTWSPDGDRIAFVSDREGNFDIYVTDLDGKNVVNLTRSPFRDFEPAWSPDGKQIAFMSDRRDENCLWKLRH